MPQMKLTFLLVLGLKWAVWPNSAKASKKTSFLFLQIDTYVDNFD